MTKVSIIVPCYNEEKNIFPFFELCKNTLNPNFEYEYIFVNDGSKDNTFLNIKKLIKDDNSDNIIGINFSRNFGKESAILAGIKNSTGDLISLIDADLQQHPKYINQMVEYLSLNEETDIVACYQNRRKEGKILSSFKSMFYNLINKMSSTKFEKNASDFRTFRRQVAEALVDLDEYHRFSKGLFAWVGFEAHYMPYEVEERLHGKTSWSFSSLTKYAIEGFVGFSTVPLRIATLLGIFTSIASLIYMISIIIKKLVIGIDVAGYATIVSLILLLSGIQLISMGIIGEYLARTYMETKKRPHYIIKNKIETDNK
ncbi:glycosyltransferase family 2 protein [uncultured Helcococcus sp.]|uniref:glycosyltransferase family 2 protein n=1 Tax=uncultured Helcococcus sp. TaxID=1072508 RepID=UPI00288B6029|nr:glycosyltransferase family 2 protein [uncultured Helcococcus sp.]